jgi:molybdate transport system substrate-binding protein
MTRKLQLAALIAATMAFSANAFDANSAAAAEIKLMTTGAMRGALQELIPQFERATGHRVIVEIGVVVPLKRRIDAGETFDIVALTPALIDDLTKQGKIGARVAFVRSGLAIGVPKGAAKPDIGSVDAFKRALLNAKSVGYEPESQPGIQFLEVLELLGIARDMQPKLKVLRGGPAGLDLIQGQVDMVASSTGAVLGNPTADFAGGFPREIQRYLNFTAGISATTKEPKAAKELLSFLMSPAAMAVFKARGLEGY